MMSGSNTALTRHRKTLNRASPRAFTRDTQSHVPRRHRRGEAGRQSGNRRSRAPSGLLARMPLRSSLERRSGVDQQLSSSSQPSRAADDTPSLFGRFRILRTLAFGEMAQILLAREERTGRLVVLSEFSL